jgi:hypothetical protein
MYLYIYLFIYLFIYLYLYRHVYIFSPIANVFTTLIMLSMTINNYNPPMFAATHYQVCHQPTETMES